VLLADVPVSVVFVFPGALSEDKLADGLATALARVPVFAGRLRTRPDGLDILCDDSGVPFTTSATEDTVADVVARVTLPGSGYVRHVDAPATRHGTEPLLSVHATRLADGPTVVGCSFQHAVGDMRTFMLLMRAWSAAVEGTPPPEVLQLPDRDEYLSSVLPPTDCGRPGVRVPDEAEAAALRREVELAVIANRTVQVYFGAAEVARLRAAAMAATGRRLSTNDVLCAHLVGTIRALDGDPVARSLAVTVDIRPRLGLPLAAVGNLLDEVQVWSAADQPVPALAGDLRSAVDDFARSHLKHRANLAFVSQLGWSRVPECVPVFFDPPGRAFTVSNWSGFGAYGVAFEGQRPVLVSPAAATVLPWTATLIEGFDGTGFLCAVTLPARLAARLRTPDGTAALHRHRQPGDALPPLASHVRKLL
jgi:hypothetical protein